jgi:hypothetical protein
VFGPAERGAVVGTVADPRVNAAFEGEAEDVGTLGLDGEVQEGATVGLEAPRRQARGPRQQAGAKVKLEMRCPPTGGESCQGRAYFEYLLTGKQIKPAKAGDARLGRAEDAPRGDRDRSGQGHGGAAGPDQDASPTHWVEAC